MSRYRFLVLLIALVVGTALSGCGQKVVDGKQKEVSLLQLTPADMVSKMKAGELEAFVAWEPFPAQIQMEGYGRYLLGSKDIWPNHPCCVVAYRAEAVTDDALRALVWAHIKATEFINQPQNRERVIKYAAEFAGKDETIISKALENIEYVTYPDKGEFRRYYVDLRDGGILKKSAQDIGYSSDEDFFKDFLREDIYQEVSKALAADPNWQPRPVSGEIRLGYINHDLHQLAVYVAQREGFYERVGLKPGANLQIKYYPNGVAIMEAFRAKEVEAAYLGGAPAVLKRVNDNIPIRIVAGANNEGSFIVVANNRGINSISDLAGREVAIPGFGTVQHYLLQKALEKANLRSRMK